MKRSSSVSPVLLIGLAAYAIGAGLWACSSEESAGSKDSPTTADQEAGASLESEGGTVTPGTEADATGLPPVTPDDAAVILPDGAAPLSPKEVCEAYVKAACLRREQCGQRPINCEAVASLCPDYLFSAGSSLTPATVAQCTQVRAQQSCAEVLQGIEPPCVTAGARAATESCQFASQCASLRCGNGVAGQCARCAAIVGPDAGCPGIRETCGQNQTCPSQAVGCVPIDVPATLAVGAACPTPDAGVGAPACPRDTPCAATAALASQGQCTALPSSGPCLFAVGAATASLCASDRTCLRSDPGIAGGECVGPGTKDALCGLSNNSRPCADGFFCTNTVQGTCQPVHALGETCQRSAQCAAAFYCARPTGPLGTCVARQATGDNCGMHATDAGLVNRECEVGATCDIIIPADGGPSVQACVKRGELGDPCTPPYRMCTGNRLTCSAGVCSLPSCQTDAGDGG